MQWLCSQLCYVTAANQRTLIEIEFLATVGWKRGCQPFSCPCWQNVTHCRKELCSSCLFKTFPLPMPCHTMSHPSREFLYCRGQHMFPSIRWLKWLWFSYVVDGCHDYRLRADEYIQFSHLGWMQKKNKSNTNSSRGYQPDSCFWGVFSPKSWFLQENPLSAIWGFSLRNASLGMWCTAERSRKHPRRRFVGYVCLRNLFPPFCMGFPIIHSLPEAGSWERQSAPPVLHYACIMPFPLL